MKKIVIVVVSVVLIVFIFYPSWSNDNIYIEGEWRMTHYKHKDSLILESNIDIAPREVPFHKSLPGYISVKEKQMVFNYGYHNEISINSRFIIVSDTSVSKIIITKSGDSLFNGEYNFQYFVTIDSIPNAGNRKLKEEIIQLISVDNLIYLYRNKVLTKTPDTDYSRPRRPF
jgi:hypothetical protein